jgi:O-antigen/teichoic acid export membrane protein
MSFPERPASALGGDPAVLAGAAIDEEAAPFEAAGPLSREELKERASAGISIVATRGLAILVLSALGNVVLARLLTPRDFGLVAIGMSAVVFTSLLSDGGLGAGLIRRPEPPLREELEALTGFQLAVSGVVALAAVTVGSFFGEIGWITAVMVASMPVAVLQFPGKILLERSLAYRTVAVVEVGQVLAYQAWAIGLVVAGAGVWGLATATIVMRVVAALLMARVSPAGFPRARLSWRWTRPLLGFGARFQATSAAWLVREQGLNISLAAISGVAVLGLLTLARRLLEIPYLLFTSLFRVSFPTMSQLVARNDDTTGLIERAVGMAAVGSGILLVALAGSARGLVPGVFGDPWRGASSILPLACLGLGIGGSVSVATQGYLYAVGDVTAVLWSVVLQTAALFAVALPLVPSQGVRAIGIGLLVSFLVETAVLVHAMRRHLTVRLLRPLVVPVVAGVAAGAAGWRVAGLAGNDLVTGAAGGLVAVAVFLAVLAVARRSLLSETLRFAVGSFRRAASARATA